MNSQEVIYEKIIKKLESTIEKLKIKRKKNTNVFQIGYLSSEIRGIRKSIAAINKELSRKKETMIYRVQKRTIIEKIDIFESEAKSEKEAIKKIKSNPSEHWLEDFKDNLELEYSIINIEVPDK